MKKSVENDMSNESKDTSMGEIQYCFNDSVEPRQAFSISTENTIHKSNHQLNKHKIILIITGSLAWSKQPHIKSHPLTHNSPQCKHSIRSVVPTDGYSLT